MEKHTNVSRETPMYDKMGRDVKYDGEGEIWLERDKPKWDMMGSDTWDYREDTWNMMWRDMQREILRRSDVKHGEIREIWRRRDVKDDGGMWDITGPKHTKVIYDEGDIMEQRHVNMKCDGRYRHQLNRIYQQSRTRKDMEIPGPKCMEEMKEIA